MESRGPTRGTSRQASPCVAVHRCFALLLCLLLSPRAWSMRLVALDVVMHCLACHRTVKCCDRSALCLLPFLICRCSFQISRRAITATGPWQLLPSTALLPRARGSAWRSWPWLGASHDGELAGMSVWQCEMSCVINSNSCWRHPSCDAAWLTLFTAVTWPANDPAVLTVASAPPPRTIA